MFNRDEKSPPNQEKYGLNKKAVTVILLVLMAAAFLLVPISLISGQLLGVNIYQVTPTGQAGPVGQSVNIQASIDTKNGAYQVWFGSNLVASSNAEGYYVNANFTVPELQGGNYTVTLRDAKENANATKEFMVTPAYYVSRATARRKQCSAECYCNRRKVRHSILREHYGGASKPP